MRPLIGITSTLTTEKDRVTLRTSYTEMIAAAGGALVILPLASEATAGDIVARLDGLILSGGSDIPAQCFGAEPHPSCHYMPMERWESDRLWLQTAQKLRVPVLGICLGMQEINVAGGGTLIQDLPSQRPQSQPHTAAGPGQLHEISIAEGSWLLQVAPSRSVPVMSAHHQSVDRLADGYRVVATAADGVIEAIEAQGAASFVVGVQWHPERCPDQPNWLLKGFAARCGQQACPGTPGETTGPTSSASYERCPISDVLKKVLEM